MHEPSATTEAAVAQDSLYVPPVAWEPLEGPAVEHVLFVRDEMGNLCCGIEKTVEWCAFEPPRHPLSTGQRIGFAGLTRESR